MTEYCHKIAPPNQNKRFFEYIIGYVDIKRLFTRALDSAELVYILLLLSGQPASAKNLFIKALMKLHNSYFVDASSATNACILSFIFYGSNKIILQQNTESHHA